MVSRAWLLCEAWRGWLGQRPAARVYRLLLLVWPDQGRQGSQQALAKPLAKACSGVEAQLQYHDVQATRSCNGGELERGDQRMQGWFWGAEKTEPQLVQLSLLGWLIGYSAGERGLKNSQLL